MRSRIIAAAVLGAIGLSFSLAPAPLGSAEPALAGTRAEKTGGNLSAEAGRAFERARLRLDLQTELPRQRPSAQQPPKQNSPPPQRQIPQWLSKIFQVVAVGAILGVVIFYLRRYFRGRRLRLDEPAEAGVSDQGEPSARMTQARDSADALAQEGDFTKAMHVLLLQSVAELRRRLDISIAAYLTSREILARMNLNQEAGRAFADVISRVEISYFGLYQPGQEDYLACRASFESLKKNLGPGDGA